MIRLDDGIVQTIRKNRPKRTHQSLMNDLGISYNTLRKIERGEPIRPSVAERLLERFDPNSDR